MTSTHSKLRPLKRAILSAAVLASISHAASAVEVTPYFHAWSGPLGEMKRLAGVDSAILAFAITRGSCAFDANITNKLPDARNFVAAGGQVTIAFGGADGVYAEVACRDDNQLFALLEKLMLDSGIRRFDFDVEGHQLNNVEATARRARVLARLQAKYPDLHIVITLPGWIRGLNQVSLDLLDTTAAAGVRIDMVNVMAMSFGVENLRTMVVPSTVAQAVIMTFRGAANQLATGIYRNLTPAQLHEKMGLTPMIGKNDDGAIFTLADARTVADFAKLNGIGLLSYWSIQRDRAQSHAGQGPVTGFSGVAQSDFQFTQIFRTAAGHSAPPSAPGPVAAPAPAPAPAPSPAPGPSAGTNGACGDPATWTRQTRYAAGSVVSQAGVLYTASRPSENSPPQTTSSHWSRYFCAGTTAGVPAPAPAPAPVACAKAPAWFGQTRYTPGSIVSRNGATYVATLPSQNSAPEWTSTHWARKAC